MRDKKQQEPIKQSVKLTTIERATRQGEPSTQNRINIKMDFIFYGSVGGINVSS